MPGLLGLALGGLGIGAARAGGGGMLKASFSGARAGLGATYRRFPGASKLAIGAGVYAGAFATHNAFQDFRSTAMLAKYGDNETTRRRIDSRQTGERMAIAAAPLMLLGGGVLAKGAVRGAGAAIGRAEAAGANAMAGRELRSAIGARRAARAGGGRTILDDGTITFSDQAVAAEQRYAAARGAYRRPQARAPRQKGPQLVPSWDDLTSWQGGMPAAAKSMGNFMGAAVKRGGTVALGTAKIPFKMVDPRTFKGGMVLGAGAGIGVGAHAYSQRPQYGMAPEGTITGIRSAPRGGISPSLQMSTQGLSLNIHSRRKRRVV